MYTIFVHKPVNANDFVLKAKVNYFEVQFYVVIGYLLRKKIYVSQNWLKHVKNYVIMNYIFIRKSRSVPKIYRQCP